MVHSWLIGASVAAFVATGARAQTQAGAVSQLPVQSRTTNALPNTTQTTDAGTPRDQSGLADIIVTAQRIETSLQKTPQAITAIDGDELQRLGVVSVQDLNKLVSGLTIESNGSNNAIYIRGIGSRTLSPTSDPAIAFGVDGVYLSRAAGLSSFFFDLERVEAVKGPQGTLYGRNATGGAINLITRHPRLGERSATGEVEVGNYNAIRAFAAVNVPLGANAALRVAGQTTYNSGYLSDGYGDINQQTARVSLTFEPSDTFRIFASADYADQGGQGQAYVPQGPSTLPNTSGIVSTRFLVPGDPYAGPSDPRVNAILQALAPPQAVPGPTAGIFCQSMVVGPPTPGGIPARPLCGQPLGIANIGTDGFLNNAYYGGNLTIEANLGFANLTVIGGYRATDIDTVQRPDINGQRLFSEADQYSGEIRLSSGGDDDRLRWVIGGFYSREDQKSNVVVSSNNMSVPVPGTPVFCATAPVAGFCLARPPLIQDRIALADPDITAITYAGFGQATFGITDWFRVTGGIRFTHEDKESLNGSSSLFFTVPAGTSRSYASGGRVEFDNKSYRAGIEIDLAERSLLYAHYSTGFHAGGFNLGVEQGPNRYFYDPEKVQSYVVGIKNRFFDNRLQLNVEGFYLDYNNYQFSSLGRINDGLCTLATVGSCPTTVRVDNAPGVRIKGIEAELALRVGRNGMLDLNVLYNDAKYRRFGTTNLFTGAITSYDGFRLPAANTWTINAGYTQHVPLDNGGRIVASALTQYRNGAFLWYTQLPSQYQEGYTRSDLTLGYEAPENRWNLRGFVRNVEDKATSIQGTTPNGTTGLAFTVLNPPRTYGVAFGFNF